MGIRTGGQVLNGDTSGGGEPNWSRWEYELTRDDVGDVGKAAILAGNARLPGLDPNFGTNRLNIRPRQLPPSIGRAALPPDVVE